MGKTIFKIDGGFVFHKTDGGNGNKYNIGEPVPQEIIDNPKLLENLLKMRKIGTYDAETNKKVKTKYDFLDLPDDDITFIANSFGWQELIDRVSFGNLSLNVLKKLKVAVGVSEAMQNKESVIQVIDNKIKGIEAVYEQQIDKSTTEETADDKKKSTASKR